MKTFTNALLLAAIALTLSAPALAQEGDEPPGAKPSEGDREPERAKRREGRQGHEGRQGRRRSGWMSRMGIHVEELKEPLGLSDEQASKLEAVNAELQRRMQEFMERMRSGEAPDRSKMRSAMQRSREELRAKIQEILTPEQFTKYQELRQKRMREGRRRWGAKGRNRENLTKRLRKQAVDALALDEEAAVLVLPLLDAVLETRRLTVEETKHRRDAFRKQVREASDPDALTLLLKEFRSAAEEDRERVAASQASLRELLTLQQEAKLVGLQILD